MGMSGREEKKKSSCRALPSQKKTQISIIDYETSIKMISQKSQSGFHLFVLVGCGRETERNESIINYEGYL